MSKNVSVLDIDRITSVLHRRCQSMGVNLKWSQSATTAMTNGKTITIPAVHAPVTKEAMDKLYGFVIHEAGHHSRPDVFKIGNALKNPPQELLHLFNITEDEGMEREVAEKYGGDAIALGKMNRVILDEITDNWGEREFPAEMTDQQAAPMAVCALSQMARTKWDGISSGKLPTFFNGLPPKVKELTDALANEGWVTRLQGTGDPHDTFDLAVDLYKRLFPDSDEDKMEQHRQDGHAMQPPSKEDGDSSDGNGQRQQGDVAGEGDEAEAQGKGQQGKGQQGDGEDGDGKAMPEEGMVVSWKEAVLSEHSEWSAKDLGESAGNIGIDWEDYTEGEVGLMPQNLINVIDCRGDQEVAEYGSYGEGTPESFIANNEGSRAFGNQIRRYLQAKRRTRVQRERYTGRLDKSSLIKLALPPIDGGEWNKKLFYDHQDRKELNTAIHILTDWSGSMQGSKMVHAADASGRLVHVFDRVLRVPVQLAAFTNGRSRCDIGLIKKFSDRSISPQNIAENFSKFYKYSSANNDADAVMWAYNQLMKRKEDRKILIVLSDGCPAGAWAGHGSDNLKHVCQTIEQEGEIELYGVGIKSEAVRSYYSKYRVLNDEHDINATLFNIIKDGAYK
jgi:cobaltochelatase CobT